MCKEEVSENLYEQFVTKQSSIILPGDSWEEELQKTIDLHYKK